MRTVFIVMDSLSRRFLSPYGGDWVKTPNIQRLADRSAVFENHWSGSLPCMPARREMMTGRLNFLEGPWGPVEPYDDCFPTELRKQGVYTHLITDHYHYFELRGSHYNTLFNTWEFHRGQEGDPWIPQVKDPEVPKFYGKNRRQDWVNRQFIKDEEDFPGPQCFKSGMEFLERNHTEDNWFLQLEVFDPHEPFYVPDTYKEMYPDDWNEFHFDWPAYEQVKQPPEAVQHARNRYAALLTMTDHWLGRFLDKMDELDMWDDTMVVLTTDHGILLGEHGYWMKNYMPVYNEVAHIPLLVYHPQFTREAKRVKSLTTTIDLMPTFLDAYGAERPPHVQGHTLLGLLQRDVPFRDAVLYGYFGKAINMTDGRYTYFREPSPGSTVYAYTAHAVEAIGKPEARSNYAGAEYGQFLNHTYGIPVYRMKRRSSRADGSERFNAIYDLSRDYAQKHPIEGGPVETELEEKMLRLLHQYQVLPEQFKRVGLEF